jgi:FkbM family methyltransferase
VQPTSQNLAAARLKALALKAAEKARKAYINIISKAIWINEAIFFEPKLRALYRKLKTSGAISKIPIIVDIGANRGQAACFFNRLLPESRIIAIEANPDLIGLLRRKTKQINIQILPLALSSKPGILTFYSCVFDEVSTLEPPSMDSKYLRFKSRVLMTPPGRMYKTVDIKTDTLDHVVSDLRVNSIDILKIDVEGHEASVLLGAKSTLSRCIPRFIQLESHGDDQYAEKGDKAQAILTAHGYRMIAKIKHGFGNFFEEVYVSPRQARI